jgi:hypothetical protein
MECTRARLSDCRGDISTPNIVDTESIPVRWLCEYTASNQIFYGAFAPRHAQTPTVGTFRLTYRLEGCCLSWDEHCPIEAQEYHPEVRFNASAPASRSNADGPAKIC